MYMYLVKMRKVATTNFKHFLTHTIVKMYHFLKKQNSTVRPNWQTEITCIYSVVTFV